MGVYQHNRKTKYYLKDYLDFDQSAELIVFKYAYHLPLKKNEYNPALCEKVPQNTIEWEKYIQNKFCGKDNENKRKELCIQADLKREEYTIYDNYNTAVLLSLLASLLLQLVLALFRPLEEISFGTVPVWWIVFFVAGLYSLFVAMIFVFTSFFASYGVVTTMKNRYYLKKMYAEIVRVLRDGDNR